MQKTKQWGTRGNLAAGHAARAAVALIGAGLVLSILIPAKEKGEEVGWGNIPGIHSGVQKAGGKGLETAPPQPQLRNIGARGVVRVWVWGARGCRFVKD